MLFENTVNPPDQHYAARPAGPLQAGPVQRLAIFTICSNNYLSLARILLASAFQHHPEAEMFLCLVDQPIAGSVDTPSIYPETVQIITLEQLGIDNIEDFTFRYDSRQDR